MKFSLKEGFIAHLVISKSMRFIILSLITKVHIQKGIINFVSKATLFAFHFPNPDITLKMQSRVLDQVHFLRAQKYAINSAQPLNQLQSKVKNR